MLVNVMCCRRLFESLKGSPLFIAVKLRFMCVSDDLMWRVILVRDKLRPRGLNVMLRAMALVNSRCLGHRNIMLIPVPIVVVLPPPVRLSFNVQMEFLRG